MGSEAAAVAKEMAADERSWARVISHLQAAIEAIPRPEAVVAMGNPKEMAKRLREQCKRLKAQLKELRDTARHLLCHRLVALLKDLASRIADLLARFFHYICDKVKRFFAWISNLIRSFSSSSSSDAAAASHLD